MRDLSRVWVVGPLRPFAGGFAAELGLQGSRRQSVAEHLLLVASLSDWLEAEALDAVGLADEQVLRFVAARRAAGHANHLTPRSLAPLLSYLRRLGVVPAAPPPVAASAVEVLLARFAEYLAVERGLAAGTVWDYAHAVRPFLEARPVVEDGQVGRVDLAELSAGEVTAFVVRRCPGQSRGAAKMTVTALRSLLAFGHLHGLIGRSLVGAVPSAASWRLSGLPRALEPGQVRALLGSCDQTTAMGLRDFAVLTVLWRLSCGPARPPDCAWRTSTGGPAS